MSSKSIFVQVAWSVQKWIFSSSTQLAVIVTSSLFIGFECIVMTEKLRKLTTSLILEVFWDCTWTRLKNLKFSDWSNLISPEIQQSDWLQNCITSKPFIVSRCANHRWNDEKLLYTFSVEIYIRFWLHGHQNLKFINVAQLSQNWRRWQKFQLTSCW
jgi:hypothetical protein